MEAVNEEKLFPALNLTHLGPPVQVLITPNSHKMFAFHLFPVPRARGLSWNLYNKEEDIFSSW